ncbi:NAD(P)H-dependent glycerol-3-phosphate dehydrogenase [candidate division KSB1 bacterium]|nr:NAD(P)H-dependent glycerol-3-phosphate dehydrogenase [candidate division KSB1 bacterium]
MSENKSKKVAVLGAGSWGTALALVLQANGNNVTMWEFRPEAAERLKTEHENKEFLPGVPIPSEIYITGDLIETCTNKDILVVAVPSHVVRSVAEKIDKISMENPPIVVNVAKGIENDSLMRMSEVLKSTIHWMTDELEVTLSGPSHAEEVSRKIPTAVVVAGNSGRSAEVVQQAFMNEYFRVYTNDDVIGVELGGALKNIIAIAAGICDGAGFGDNTKAALQPRGLAEIARLGTALGAKPVTFAGLSGMGDLIVTCMSRHSRNRFVGEQIGKGRKLPDILKDMVMVAEGVRTTKSAYELSKKVGVDMPITEQVYLSLFEDKDPFQALQELMTRDPKKEELG